MPESMRQAQSSWASLPIEARLSVLSRARQAICTRLPVWVETVAGCRNCSPSEALSSEILPLLDALHYLERDAARVLAVQRPSKALLPHWLRGIELEIRRAPLGTILVIGPGNYPLFLPGVQIAQALTAGNAVLVKPQVDKAGPVRDFVSLLLSCGLPVSLVEVLDTSVDSAQAAIRAGVDKIVLTGSVATGRSVLAEAAAALTPVVAELSGADLVWAGPGADLTAVCRAVQWGTRLNRGETCMAPRRVLCRSRHLAELESHLAVRAVALDDPRWDAPPEGALLLAACDDDAAALALTDRCRLALGASLFGEQEWARRVAPLLRVGFITINDLIAPTADPRLPFGGRKESGFGVTRGAEGLLEMTAAQAISTRVSGECYHFDTPTPYEYSILHNYTRFVHGSGWRTRAAGLVGMLVSVGRQRLARKRGR